MSKNSKQEKIGYHARITELARKFSKAMVCTIRKCPVCGGDAALYVTASRAMFICANEEKLTIHAFDNNHGDIGAQIGFEIAHEPDCGCPACSGEDSMERAANAYIKAWDRDNIQW